MIACFLAWLRDQARQPVTLIRSQREADPFLYMPPELDFWPEDT